MVLPSTHLEFDIRNDFPFNSFLNRVRKPFSNTIWVLKWSHLVSVLFYKVWRCSAPLYAWQLQACICATATECCSPGWFVEFIWGLSLAQTLKHQVRLIPLYHSPPHFIICLPPADPFPVSQSSQSKPRLTGPRRDQRTLQLEGVVFTLIIQLLLFLLRWISGFPQKRELFRMPDVWGENRPLLQRQEGKKRGKKEYPSF